MSKLKSLINKIPYKMWSRLFLIFVIIFFCIYLFKIDFSKLEGIRFDWVMVGIATFFGLIFRFWGVFIWRSILTDLGSQTLPRFPEMSFIYAKAWMGRYIPGTVTWIAGKIYMANSHGISKSRLAVSSLLEGGMQVAAIATVSALLIAFDFRLSLLNLEIRLMLLGLGLLCLLVLTPPIFNRLMKIAFRLLRKTEASEELSVTPKAVFRSFLLYAFGTFISGTSVFFLTQALYSTVQFDLYFYLVGAFSMAGAIGMAVPFLPSGIGIREGALVLFLSPIFSGEGAVLIAIVTRLWAAVADLLFLFFSWLIVKLPFKLSSLNDNGDNG
ncbi:lysylphosphatidylglycerol synthase domain-containing protein [Leptospira saintgironsiae]|uniref:TIGR00374 family protein n=1 Tax=Leptospira saintgironsiae TaxID=2023183 RepID=A0A2M9YA34_9LEPT|nr:lysylphosphatidylglycerol synthase domain-containing protein [Leptospira saintgironsiae]PJZ48420.1 hypothetical protein CH362_14525 [Leptospira saintgironsiae]